MQVLARIFMVRSDVGYTVRTAAVHVWKTVVTNTPRTTGEILTTLMDQIIESLGHYSEFFCTSCSVQVSEKILEVPKGSSGCWQLQGSCFCCPALCPAPAVHVPCASKRVQCRLLLLTLSSDHPALPLLCICVQSHGKLLSHR